MHVGMIPPSSNEDFDQQLGNSLIALREMRNSLLCVVCILFSEKDFGVGADRSKLAAEVNPEIFKQKLEQMGLMW